MAAGTNFRIELKSRGIAWLLRIITYQEGKRGLKMADLFHRVSIRKFKDEAVSNEDIGYILEAAMAAPSAKNQQPWEFYVVTNKDLI